MPPRAPKRQNRDARGRFVKAKKSPKLAQKSRVKPAKAAKPARVTFKWYAPKRGTVGKGKHARDKRVLRLQSDTWLSGKPLIEQVKKAIAKASKAHGAKSAAIFYHWEVSRDTDSGPKGGRKWFHAPWGTAAVNLRTVRANAIGKIESAENRYANPELPRINVYQIRLKAVDVIIYSEEGKKLRVSKIAKLPSVRKAPHVRERDKLANAGKLPKVPMKFRNKRKRR